MITNYHNTDEQPDDADSLAEYGIGAGAPPVIIEQFESRFDVRLVKGYGWLPLLRRPEGLRHPATGRQRFLVRGRERPQQQPALKEAPCSASPDDRGNEAVKAVVIPKPG